MDPFRGTLPFLRVAEAQSFSAAARELGVTPAAVSKAIAALETELGVRLFERTSRRVSLTAEGATYYERCREALLQVEAARELVTRAQRAPRGEVVISTSPILARPLCLGIGQLLARYPELIARLRVTDRVVDLVEERVDVAVRLGPVKESQMLVARPLLETRWVTLASPSYLARHGEPAQPADLSRHALLPFITPRGVVAEWFFLEADGISRVRPAAAVDVDHGDRLLDLAEAGVGICQVLDFMLDERLRDGRLVEVLEGRRAPGPPVHAVTLRRRLSPRVRAVVRWLEETLAG